jgi:hypothetical protein
MVLGALSAAMVLAQTGTVQQAALWERSKSSGLEHQTSTPKQAPPKSTEQAKAEETGVEEAVKWERAKDRAAERQAQIESGAASKNTTAKSKK